MTIKSHSFEGSSMLDKCQYDTDARELTVTFHNGKDYTYENVSEEAYEGLTKAKSAGQFFGQYIKGNYDIKKDDK